MKSVRLRLLILALLPLVVLLPVFLGTAMARWADKFDDLLISKVASDLRIAEQYLQRIIKVSGDEVTALAGSVEFQNASNGNAATMSTYLETNRVRLGLDFLKLQPTNIKNTRSAIYERGLKEGAATAIDIFSGSELKALSPDLAKRATIPLIATEAAIPTNRTTEDRGMVLHSAVQVNMDGQEAILTGGILLNRNLNFIDTINDLVYRRPDGQEVPQGTATLFLDDVRISTNVRLFENVRALGTRVSAIVRRAVMDEGRTWLDRAFVVNDWYISGYLPIVDSHDQRIGMLYVGFLEEPFRTMKNTTFIAVFFGFIIVIGLSIPLFLWLARGIFSPLEKMTETMERIEQGDLKARIGIIGSKDEIGQVASHLDTLLDQVQERDQALRDWAGELNERVDQRTNELHEANKKLEATFQQLVMSEKLASIGEITAGVAHEINNPVAVIQGNLDVLRQTLQGRSEDVQTELKLIDEQIHRINVIVNKLLQFASPGSEADFAERVQMEEVMEDCLVLVQNSLARSDVTISTDLITCPAVHINKSELQQVLINLMINATQAMKDGGHLNLSVAPKTKNGIDGVEAEVSDNGPGIPSEILAKIFDPFFTTRRGKGTGLGLSISQTLIQRAGGIISVNSTKQNGSQFIIWLPAADTLS
ncbi:MAG: two-component sensor histidine kinase [Hyphomicrobiales bacterium]|nr:MAG: two-component sensor histidine kinase [Hyphomicrobiales bacterium]